MKQLSLLLVCFVFSTLSFAQTIRYVKPVASGDADGSSWANASNDPQEIINISAAGDQIWVAAGTYKPTQDPFGTFNPVNPRNKTFYLRDSVKLYGGFAGNETNFSQRNWTVNTTVLSGDFNGNDVVTGSGATLNIANNAENAYHVVLSIGDSKETVLDGFVVSGGCGNSSSSIIVEGVTIYANRGGGYLGMSQTKLSNLVFYTNYIDDGQGAGLYLSGYITTNIENIHCIKNKADNYNYNWGGGLFIGSYSKFNIYESSFEGNFASYGAGVFTSPYSSIEYINSLFDGNEISNQFNSTISGAALYENGEASTTYSSKVINCIFTNNKCLNKRAGAIYNQGNITAINNSIFSNNAANEGGAIYNNQTTAITNCIFTNNNANKGGAIYAAPGSAVTILNCTIANNTTSNTFGGAGIYNYQSNTIIKNSILWGNISTGGTPSMYNDNATTTVSYSTIEWPSIYAGTGNKKVNPQFVNINDPDGADNIWGNDDDGLMLQSTSPAINNGNLTNAPLNDIRGRIRVGNPDMGAYEYGGLVSIDDFTDKKVSLNVFPNPTNGLITLNYTLEAQTKVNINIFDALGKLVFANINDATQGEQVQHLNLEHLASGVYVLNIQTDLGSFVGKIVKE